MRIGDQWKDVLPCSYSSHLPAFTPFFIVGHYVLYPIPFIDLAGLIDLEVTAQEVQWPS